MQPQELFNKIPYVLLLVNDSDFVILENGIRVSDSFFADVSSSCMLISFADDY